VTTVTEVVATPRPIEGLLDRPMWDSIRARRMRLQSCAACGRFRYPPAPICPNCLSEEAAWSAISGRGTIVSWIVFHRRYLAAYHPPYNVIAVRLEEGPLMISNLEGVSPSGSWIGSKVSLTYTTMPDGAVLPRFALE
jgi:uncharacterized OB-fold protein